MTSKKKIIKGAEFRTVEPQVSGNVMKEKMQTNLEVIKSDLRNLADADGIVPSSKDSAALGIAQRLSRHRHGITYCQLAHSLGLRTQTPQLSLESRRPDGYGRDITNIENDLRALADDEGYVPVSCDPAATGIRTMLKKHHKTTYCKFVKACGLKTRRNRRKRKAHKHISKEEQALHIAALAEKVRELADENGVVPNANDREGDRIRAALRYWKGPKYREFVNSLGFKTKTQTKDGNGGRRGKHRRRSEKPTLINDFDFFAKTLRPHVEACGGAIPRQKYFRDNGLLSLYNMILHWGGRDVVAKRIDILPAIYEEKMPYHRRPYGRLTDIRNVEVELRSKADGNGVIPKASDPSMEYIVNALRRHHNTTYNAFAKKCGLEIEKRRKRRWRRKPNGEGGELGRQHRPWGKNEEQMEEYCRPETTEERKKELEALLVEANLRLVHWVAGRYVSSTYSLGRAELVSVGCSGLLNAIRKYDHTKTKGAKLSSYAWWWIRQAIQRHVHSNTSNIQLPEYIVVALSKMGRVEEELKKAGVKLTEAKVAEKMGCDIAQVNELRKVRRVGYVLSMNAPAKRNKQDRFDHGELGDSVAIEQKNPEEAVMDGALIERLRQLITDGHVGSNPRSKHERNGKIVLARLEGRTQRSIAHEWSITPQRVTQICQKEGGKFIEALRQEVMEEKYGVIEVMRKALGEKD